MQYQFEASRFYQVSGARRHHVVFAFYEKLGRWRYFTVGANAAIDDGATSQDILERDAKRLLTRHFDDQRKAQG